MGAYVHVMGDLTQIVEFGPGVYKSFIKRATVDTTIGTNLYVGFECSRPNLRDLEMALTVEHETKAVGTNYDPGMKNHAVSDLRSRI